jgi:hypothetical protein
MCVCGVGEWEGSDVCVEEGWRTIEGREVKERERVMSESATDKIRWETNTKECLHQIRKYGKNCENSLPF